MEAQNTNSQAENKKFVGIRSSGRVGHRYFRTTTEVAANESSLSDVIKIYQQLLNFHDRRDSELAEALSYGLKLIDTADKPPKKKRPVIRSLFRH